jgi:hypothetical protein
MRKVLPDKLENGRLRAGWMASDRSFGPYGAFFVQGPCGCELKIVASGGEEAVCEGWEHVSISTPRRPPNWQEMCFVKDLFWDAEECVIQFHPPASTYVNNHPHCLHLWKPPFDLPLPPAILVGVKSAGVIKSEADALALHRAANGG